jgi:hypothetical protein
MVQSPEWDMTKDCFERIDENQRNTLELYSLKHFWFYDVAFWELEIPAIVLPPLLLYIIAMVGSWIWHGFKPRADTDEIVLDRKEKSMTDELIKVYFDPLPNQPKTDQSREEIATLLRRGFEQRFADAVDRYWELPAVWTLNPDDQYRELLVEARELFVAGYFYSCVAMCGIVAERLIKDMFRTSLLIQRNGKTEIPTKEAFDQLEQVEIRGMINFLKESGLLIENAAKSARVLGDLRNNYAHARGKAPQTDAIKAIKELHVIVEGTVSVFKDFEIKEGRLVQKI